MASGSTKAARTRAYNKQFEQAKFLEPLGAQRLENGLWRLPDGSFISAYAGRPGKVALMLSGPNLERHSNKTFGVNELEEMRAFVAGEPSKAQSRAALAKLAPEMLEALRAVWSARGEPADAKLAALDLVAKVLDKAEGRP